MNKLLFVCMLLLFLSTTGCSKDLETPEQQVRAIVAEIESGIEDRSVSQVIEHISNDYKDHKGRSKQDIKRYVQLHILRNQNITILNRITSLSIQDDLATVELSLAAVARGTKQNLSSLKADTHNASIVLRKNSNHWEIISASWQNSF